MRSPFILVLLLACASWLVLAPQSGQAKKEVFDLDETYPLDPDGLITLVTEDADVKITGSERQDVHLVVHYECKRSGLFWQSKGDRFDVEVRAENGNLYIKEIEPDHNTVGVVMHSHHERHRVTLEVPQGASLRIRGDDDDYQIRNVQGSISLRCEDGDAMIEDCHGERFDFEVEDGSIEMEGGKGSLAAYLEDGDIVVYDGAFDEIEAEVEDGEIEIATKLSDAGNYHFRCEDGAIELVVLDGGGEFRIDFEDGRVSASSAFTLQEENDDYEVYSLSGGGAKVRMRIEDGRVRLSQK